MTDFDYLRDPHEIERRSFQRIRELTNLERFDEDQRQVAMRLVHTCGQPDIVESLRIGPQAIACGLAAMRGAAPVLCDVEMVRRGITPRFCPGERLCLLNESSVARRAEKKGITRSMAAVDLWLPHLADSVAVIGNAPTALFRLLELLQDGAPRPRLIIGMPVGFIGAAESKDALMHEAGKLGVTYLSLAGYRGGSALAAATVNALARICHGVRL